MRVETGCCTTLHALGCYYSSKLVYVTLQLQNVYACPSSPALPAGMQAAQWSQKQKREVASSCPCSEAAGALLCTLRPGFHDEAVLAVGISSGCSHLASLCALLHPRARWGDMEGGKSQLVGCHVTMLLAYCEKREGDH